MPDNLFVMGPIIFELWWVMKTENWVIKKGNQNGPSVSGPRPALGLGLLGQCLGPPTRERPQILGEFFFFLIFGRYKKNLVYNFFFTIKNAKKLSNVRYRGKTNLNK